MRVLKLEIKNKIIERSGYSEVFDGNNTLDGSNYSEYNSIKDAVHSKLRNWWKLQSLRYITNTKQ